MVTFRDVNEANQSGVGSDPRIEMIGKMDWVDVVKGDVEGKYLRRSRHTQSDDKNCQASLSTLGWDFEKKNTSLFGASEKVIFVKGDVAKEVQKCQNSTPSKASVLGDDGHITKRAFQAVASSEGGGKRLQNQKQRARKMATL